MALPGGAGWGRRGAEFASNFLQVLSGWRMEAGAPGGLKQIREGVPCSEKYEAVAGYSDPPARKCLRGEAAAVGRSCSGARRGSAHSSGLRAAHRARIRGWRAEGGPARFRKISAEESVSRKRSNWESRATGRTRTSCAAAVAVAADVLQVSACGVSKGFPQSPWNLHSRQY